jgi:hypothetical protein
LIPDLSGGDPVRKNVGKPRRSTPFKPRERREIDEKRTRAPKPPSRGSLQSRGVQTATSSAASLDGRGKGFSSASRLLGMVIRQGVWRRLLEIERVRLQAASGRARPSRPSSDQVPSPAPARADGRGQAKPRENLFREISARLPQRAPPESTGRLRMKNSARMVDSMAVDLCLEMRDRARGKSAKGAVKLVLRGEAARAGPRVSKADMVGVKAMPSLGESAFPPKSVDRGPGSVMRRPCRLPADVAGELASSPGPSATPPIGRPTTAERWPSPERPGCPERSKCRNRAFSAA